MFYQLVNWSYYTGDLDSLTITQKRDTYLSYINVYNIVHEEMKGLIFLGNERESYSEETSIKEWIASSKEDGSYIYSNLVWGSFLDFMYAFQTEFQKNILKSRSAGTVCIDGTHRTTSHKTYLFTLLIRNDEGRQGIPMTHLISEKKASETLIC